MELLYVALLIFIIYLLITNKSSLNEKIEELEGRILELQRLVKQVSDKKFTGSSESPAADVVAKAQEKTPEIRISEVRVPVESAEQPLRNVDPEHQKENIKDSISSIRRPTKTLTPPIMQKKQEDNPEPRLSFFESHPDLEKFIGENLINKIGIAILVLAIGFFVKYAIDNNWVGPVGRVGIGILCGGILIGIAHQMRNSYKAFSSVLVGGGLAIFYFTITLAYYQFHLFNQPTSFIILVVITCFAVALSLLYNKQELAVIALIGGLASPFMVSSGHANYHALFSYLVLLNAGLLIIAYNKSWRILNISAFVLTVLVFFAALFTLSQPTYATGFIYATVLYLLFFTINVANNIRENRKFVSSDFTILLTNTALYFGAGLYLLTVMHEENYRGLFSASLAAINLILSFLLFKNKKVDTNILYLLIGITLTFISLTAPIQLHGHNITLFWAAETVLLYWLYQKSEINLMKLTSFIVWGAMLLSLLIDWSNVYSFSGLTLNIIANKGFITTLVAAISSYLLFRLIGKNKSEDVYGAKMNSSFYKYASFILLFLSGVLEINHQFLNRYPRTSLNSIYLMLYVPGFVYIFFLLSKRISVIELSWKIAGILISLSVIVYFMFYPDFFDVQYSILVQHTASVAHFWAHWIGACFIGLIFYELIFIAKNHLTAHESKLASWILAGTVVLFLSLEVSLAGNILFYSPTNSLNQIQTIYIKTGLPILWGLSSFSLMWLGMRYKSRILRIISLTFFSITLVKLFVFDIQNIPPAGKIAAFFCLGVLLLIISFMYQKVKKIIVEDEAATRN
jgi:uncharacterized membrane protein